MAPATLHAKGPGPGQPVRHPGPVGVDGRLPCCRWSTASPGPVITQVAACASSVIAFLDGLRMIQRGEVDVVLAGGSEAPLLPDRRSRRCPTWARCPSATTTRARVTAVRPRPRRLPVRRGRRRGRPGDARSTRWRAAPPSTPRCIGAALTADAFHISAPEPTGRGATRAMTMALRDAGVAPDEVDYIVAHGTSTPLNDVTETRAIKAAFGEHARRVAISSPKSMVGHLLGAAGVMSALTAIGAIRDDVVPPTINLDEPRPAGVRPGLHAQRRAQAAGRHGDHQRLRLRRPERGRGLPPLRGVAGPGDTSPQPARARVFSSSAARAACTTSATDIPYASSISV